MQPSTLATDAMNDPDPEARCKLAPIQSKIATLIGGKVAFDSIPVWHLRESVPAAPPSPHSFEYLIK